MAQKMTGALVFDERTDRYDIRFDLNLLFCQMERKHIPHGVPRKAVFCRHCLQTSY